MLLFITTGLAISVKNAAFQYIPCYCLSELNVDSAKISSLFQYIPCYCLSKMRSAVIRRNYSFQYIPCYCLSAPRVQYGKDFLYFNTSHVTVYLNKTHINKLSISISIHPMLLFICIICGEMFEPRTFQYIPCYCLSSVRLLPCLFLQHFNTSHVTVYRISHGEILWKKEHFNTSHVTVYLAGIFEDWSNAVHFNTSHVTVYRSLHNH